MGRHSKATGRGYRGRHRAPTTSGKTVAKFATAGVVLTAAPLSMGAGVAGASTTVPAGPLDEIARCESGGSYTAQNPSSSASGKYQFIDSTWRAYRGSSSAARAKDASPAEQEAAARRLFAAEGSTPWNASKSCWQGASGAPSPQRAASESAPKAAPKAESKSSKAPVVKQVKPKPVAESVPKRVTKQRVEKQEKRVAPKAGNGKHTVVSGDTLSGLALKYTGDSWQELHERNRDVVGANPHHIVPGQVLEVRK